MAIVNGTYGKSREFDERNSLPKVGDEWNEAGYEDAHVSEVELINDEVAETTSGNTKERYNFYRISIDMFDILDEEMQTFTEYICIQKTTAKERYDARTAKHYHLKLNKGTDSEIIEKLESVDSVQGYIKEMIRKDIAK